jgi:hypothetical protein
MVPQDIRWGYNGVQRHFPRNKDPDEVKMEAVTTVIKERFPFINV